MSKGKFSLLNKLTKKPCLLTDLVVDVYCCGFLAETTVEMKFRNTEVEAQEGEVCLLEIPLTLYS
jgi:hypothetical protein